MNAEPSAEGIRAGTSFPSVYGMRGEENVLLADEIEGEAVSRF